MLFSEEIKKLVTEKEVQTTSVNFLSDIASAVLGDKIAAAKVFYSISQVPFFYNEQRFWDNMSCFLDGVFSDEDDRAKLCAKLTEDGESGENPHRLVECINRAETKQKIRYLISATRCLLSDFIERSDFFRICHVITQAIDEDLLFLRDHISEENLSYSASVQGLLNVGIMYQSTYDAEGGQEYSFTPFAEVVDRFAISYDNVERYPNPTSFSPQQVAPRVTLLPLTISDEDIQEICK